MKLCLEIEHVKRYYITLLKNNFSREKIKCIIKINGCLKVNKQKQEFVCLL